MAACALLCSTPATHVQNNAAFVAKALGLPSIVVAAAGSTAAVGVTDVKGVNAPGVPIAQFE